MYCRGNKKRIFFQIRHFEINIKAGYIIRDNSIVMKKEKETINNQIILSELEYLNIIFDFKK